MATKWRRKRRRRGEEEEMVRRDHREMRLKIKGGNEAVEGVCVRSSAPADGGEETERWSAKQRLTGVDVEFGFLSF